jgi:hypothetical protein
MLTLGGLIAFSMSSAAVTYSELFLIFPYLFFSFALAYVDRTVRILRTATYLHQYLRENLVKVLNTRELLQWETFKKYRAIKRKERFNLTKNNSIKHQIFIKIRQKLPELPLVLDVARSFQFIIPSLFSIISYIYINIVTKKALDFLQSLFIIIITVCITVLYPFYLFIKSQETLGIEIVSGKENLAEWEIEWRRKHGVG